MGQKGVEKSAPFAFPGTLWPVSNTVRKKTPKIASGNQASQGTVAHDFSPLLAGVRPDVWALALALRVDGSPFEVAGREYIIPVIRDMSDRIVIPKAAQMAFTITFLVRTLHWICERKWNHLYLLPLKTGATSFVQGRIDPIIDSNPHLAGMFTRTDNRMHKQTVDAKNLYIRGTNIATELREIPVDCQVWDERDKMVEDNLPEAEARMDGSHIGKVTELSTPTAPGHGVDAEDGWHDSDMMRWNVRCPHCSRYQVLSFKENAKLGDRADESVCECSHCHKAISDEQRREANATGMWQPTHLNGSIRGYHISQMNSPAKKFTAFLKNYYEGQTNIKKLRAFHNNQLGEPFVAEGDQITPTLLDKCIEPGHTLGGIPGGHVFIGIDVGTRIHVKASWVDRHLRRVSWNMKIFDNFDQLHNFLKAVNSFTAVIDIHPEKEKARELALNFFGKVYLGIEFDRPDQAEIAKVTSPRVEPSKREPGKVSIDRTLAFDSVISSYMTGSVVLPSNAREQGEDMPRLPHNGFYHQMGQQVAIEEEDAKGRMVRSWKHNKNPDHWHHADMFEFVATMVGARLEIPENVSNAFAAAGGLQA